MEIDEEMVQNFISKKIQISKRDSWLKTIYLELRLSFYSFAA